MSRMGCVPTVIAFLLVVLAAPAMALPRARLSGDVVPISYDISVALDVPGSRFTGTETVEVDVHHRIGAIALNARHLRVDDVTIDDRAATASPIAQIDQLALHTETPIEPGRHRVGLRFAGAISGGPPGGLSSGSVQGGPVVTTFFEPSSAREMFPSFDEPQFRARFTLHVAAPRAWTIVSNMPLSARRDDGPDLAWSDFETTPPMPTYMLTLDGGSFVHVDGAAGGVPIRVFVRPGQEDHARTVLANAERILPFYQAFFGVPFPLPKLDVVVSPGGLQSALEGWGAITFYSESAIFGNQFNGGEHGRRYAVEILAHEMAHQWFGDLVTMHWWRDTFVAEGVAEFSQQVATRTVFPELSTWVDDDDETASLMEHGVAADTLPAIIPITTDLDREDWNAFNTATYDKGAAVIEGWRLIAGARLRDGLGRYLRRFGFGSATFETFWATVGGDAGRAYGRSWLLHPGFPVVDVRATCSAGSTAVRLTQEPFVSDAAIDEAYRVRRWIVPVVLQVGGQERRALFASRRAVIRVPGCGPVAVDPDERPYYLVRYDDATYAGFADGATAGNQRDRNRLYRDATMLHAAGYLRDTPYVRLLAAERDPLSPRVWLSLAQEYRRMDLLVRDAPEARVLAAVQRRALQPFVLRYDRLDSSETAPFRLDYDPAWALGTSGDPIDGATMRDDYDRLLDGAAPKNMATPWLTAMVAASAATSDDVARSETRLRAHPPTVWTMPFEETFLENVADPVLARRVLDDALADDRLTGGNRTTFMFRLGERHPRLVFTYLRDHFRAVVTQLPPTQQAWTICTGVANSLWPAASPRELARFLRSRFPANRGIVRTATARIEQSWKQRNALRRALRTLAAAPG